MNTTALPVVAESENSHSSRAYAITARFGMFIFLLSEAMLFLGLIAGYVVLFISNLSTWLPESGAYYHLEWPLSWMNWLMILNTVLLLASSWTFHLSEVALRGDRADRALGWLTLTTILGVIFLCGQAFEWWHLKHEGLWINEGGLYAATFFTLTGFHGAHVAIGIGLLLWAWVRLLTGKVTATRYVMFENVGLYWHFVDIVWVFVFSLLYVVPFVIYAFR
ncbi:MAG: cytochrome c oxidase subunit 3 [Methylacidiphilales bacterium]|nr:cytochrome c oxidase subunit 3 [Candidatus Methylacidiphilales bacterium]MDW8350197.1 cytochrome c oxidase subunit 3 [Verrucomicrobiae bacterium]